MRLNGSMWECGACGYLAPRVTPPAAGTAAGSAVRHPTYETRRRPDRGFYVVADDGHLAHVPAEDGGVRAAIFDTQKEADAALSGSVTPPPG
jgi:hypothetical protein